MNSVVFKQGMKDGIPIGLGYFAVAFSLGIFASKSGINACEGFFASLFTLASAGEAAGFDVILKQAPYVEMALVILVANCRYLLMSFAVSCRFSQSTPMYKRILSGLFITDEIFALVISKEGMIREEYTYGVGVVSAFPWALGTMLGIIFGNIIDPRIALSLSVTLYGMFLSVIISPVRKKPFIAVVVAVSFIFSLIFDYIPFLSNIGGGIKITVLSVVISAFFALCKPLTLKDKS